jgi:hypothetical protein
MQSSSHINGIAHRNDTLGASAQMDAHQRRLVVFGHLAVLPQSEQRLVVLVSGSSFWLNVCKGASDKKIKKVNC